MSAGFSPRSSGSSRRARNSSRARPALRRTPTKSRPASAWPPARDGGRPGPGDHPAHRQAHQVSPLGAEMVEQSHDVVGEAPRSAAARAPPRVAVAPEFPGYGAELVGQGVELGLPSPFGCRRCRGGRRPGARPPPARRPVAPVPAPFPWFASVVLPGSLAGGQHGSRRSWATAAPQPTVRRPGCSFALFYEIPVARPWSPDSERRAYREVMEQAVARRPAGLRTACGPSSTTSSRSSPTAPTPRSSTAPSRPAPRTGASATACGCSPGPTTTRCAPPSRPRCSTCISEAGSTIGAGRSTTRIELEGFGIHPKDTREMWREAVEHDRSAAGPTTNSSSRASLVAATAPRASPSLSRQPHPPVFGATGSQGRPSDDGRVGPRAVLVQPGHADRGADREPGHLPPGRRRRAPLRWASS